MESLNGRTAFQSGYICSECAKSNECDWPEGHVATFHTGICEWCREEAALCHSTDWNWPGKKMNIEEREL